MRNRITEFRKNSNLDLHWLSLRLKLIGFVEHKWLENWITGLIIFNFFTILAGTQGYDLEWLENTILLIFGLEVALKLTGYGPKDWFNFWNSFDAWIVCLGILPLVLGFLPWDITLPEGFAAFRAFRLIRLLGRIEATRVLIEAIGKSLGQLGGVALLSGLFLMIFTLMATVAFQNSIPEWFGSFGSSFYSLLSMAPISHTEIMGQAKDASPLMAWVVFGGYIITVPVTALNLVIAVLSKAIDSIMGDDSPSREDFDRLERSQRLLHAKLDALLKKADVDPKTITTEETI